MLPREGDAPHLPAPPDRPAGSWERHGVEFPDPLTPFAAGWFLPIHNAALRSACKDLGLLIDRIEYREIDGCVYRRLVPFGLQRRPPALFVPLQRILVRVRPASRKRLNLAIRASRSGAHHDILDLWRTEWVPRLTSRRDELDVAAIPDGDDAALDRYAEAALRWGQDAVRARCRVLVAAGISLGIVSGAEEPLDPGALPEIRGQLAVYDPIAGQPVGAAVPTAADSHAGSLDTTSSAVLASLVESTRLAFRADVCGNLARRLGRRLAERELLNHPDDIYFLSLDEARAALRSGATSAAAAAGRRDAWQRARQASPAEQVGERLPPLPFDIYPASAAATTIALLRILDQLWGGDRAVVAATEH